MVIMSTDLASRERFEHLHYAAHICQWALNLREIYKLSKLV